MSHDARDSPSSVVAEDLGPANAALGTVYPAAERLLAAAEPRFNLLLTRLDQYAPALLAIGEAPPPQPRWRQDWFPRLDAAAAYVLVRERTPARIVEVGCGHSTRFFARAVADGRQTTRITCIDPRPRATLTGLPIELVHARVQDAGLAPFASLCGGDVLSIDGSHVLMPGTDVDLMLNRVLPDLPAGTLLHVHDIFLPDGYPPSWAWRGYNEQLGIAALLQGGGWRVLWSSHWVATRMADRLGRSIAGRLPLLPGARESSLWLEKLTPAIGEPAGDDPPAAQS